LVLFCLVRKRQGNSSKTARFSCAPGSTLNTYHHISFSIKGKKNIVVVVVVVVAVIAVVIVGYPNTSSKILHRASYFQLSSPCLYMPMKHCPSCLMYHFKRSDHNQERMRSKDVIARMDVISMVIIPLELFLD